MKKLLLIWLIFFNILFASAHKEVLLMHSYHKGYKWSDDISKSIEGIFLKYHNIKLTTVYMDTKRVSHEQYYKQLVSLYKQQFKNRKYDLIIASDNNALSFLQKYKKELFPKIPLLFCGINNFDYKYVLGNKNITGVIEQVDLEKNFELIKEIHPKLKRLYIVNDDSNTGLEMAKNLKEVEKKYSKYFEIKYIQNRNIIQIQDEIKNIDENSVILFVLLHKDKVGNYFTYKDSLEKIKNISSVPIYGLWDFYLNNGIVGGLLTSAKSQGKAVAKMAIDILENKKKISQIPIIKKSPNEYMFDYEQLKKFKIDIEKHIKEPIIINEPKSIYKEHSKFFIISILTIFILSVIVLILRANIQKRVKLEKELFNRLEFDKVLLDTIPNPIYYKSTKGKFLGCNAAFASLVESSKDEVIGKTAFNFFPKEVALKNTFIDKKLLEDFKNTSSEFTFYTPKKEMKNIILNKAVYKNIDGSIGGIVCIMDDMTERIQQKQFLIQQSKLAEMGDMIASIAHQWNEPLVELSALVQDIQTSYLLNELKDIDVNDFVNDSMVQIKYMSKTVSDFRNFLKPSTKKNIFSISKALNEINEIVGKQIFYSNINMIFDYKDNEDLMIYGYENEFKQVLLNIINNAKNKMIEKNYLSNDKGSIIINILKDEKYNIIKISDDAGNIDDNIVNSIFEPYFTTKENGTGIGLYMAKVIIEDKMQGTIRVKNDKKYVVFTIKLPLKKG